MKKAIFLLVSLLALNSLLPAAQLFVDNLYAQENPEPKPEPDPDSKPKPEPS